MVQPDGKFVVTNTPGFALTRYNPDGTLDRTFGTNGKVTTIQDGAPLAYVSRLVLQPNGKIVAAGEYCGGSIEGEGSVILARYSSSGELDPTFGSGGVARTITAERQVYTHDLEIQPDGKLLWSGSGCNTEGCYGRLLRFVGGADRKAPEIIGTAPRSNATRVDRDGNIRVTFSEDMMANSINGGTVNLYKGVIKRSNKVPANVRCVMKSVVRDMRICTGAVLNPSDRLVAVRTYRVVVEGAGDGDTRAVTDPAGNAMQAGYRWSFTTGAS